MEIVASLTIYIKMFIMAMNYLDQLILTQQGGLKLLIQVGGIDEQCVEYFQELRRMKMPGVSLDAGLMMIQ